MSKPKMVGTIYIARAKLFNADGVLIGTCTDTPNAIANAIKELSNTMYVKTLSFDTLVKSEKYQDRINKWNTCASGLIKA